MSVNCILVYILPTSQLTSGPFCTFCVHCMWVQLSSHTAINYWSCKQRNYCKFQ